MSTVTETRPADLPVFAPVARRPFGLARHAAALARRSLIKTMRNPEQLLDVVLQPILFTGLFAFLLGGAVAGGTEAYLQSLVPGLFVMLTLMATMQSGTSFCDDLNSGLFDRFRSMPIGRSAPLIGAAVGDVVRYVLTIVVLLGFSTLIGFRVETDAAHALGAAVLAIGLAFAFSWVFVLFGAVMREPSGVQGLGLVLVMPFTFGSNLLAPTETLPGWLQAWVDVNPASVAMEACRGLLTGGDVTGEVVSTVLWSVGIIAVFAPLAVAAYRRRV
ncbi:ABC transporter permease [Glycomyces arizonensis]|uniref:ABC transporter permease n=1 Tax=Glycomyces arizonensis TaxID=256035 RepID=UPI00040D04E8|nr:ABC transporter permease [Glycomyces arizonensis]